MENIRFGRDIDRLMNSSISVIVQPVFSCFQFELISPTEENIPQLNPFPHKSKLFDLKQKHSFWFREPDSKLKLLSFHLYEW